MKTFIFSQFFLLTSPCPDLCELHYYFYPVYVYSILLFAHNSRGCLVLILQAHEFSVDHQYLLGSLHFCILYFDLHVKWLDFTCRIIFPQEFHRVLHSLTSFMFPNPITPKYHYKQAKGSKVKCFPIRILELWFHCLLPANTVVGNLRPAWVFFLLIEAFFFSLES